MYRDAWNDLRAVVMSETLSLAHDAYWKGANICVDDGDWRMVVRDGWKDVGVELYWRGIQVSDVAWAKERLDELPWPTRG